MLIGFGAEANSDDSPVVEKDRAAQTAPLNPEKRHVPGAASEDLVRPDRTMLSEEMILASINPENSRWERELAEQTLVNTDPGATESLKLARKMLEESGLDAPHWQRKALKRFILARELSIEFPGRIPEDHLEQILAERMNPQVDDRPLAVVVYPKGDHNGAFYLSSNIFEEMIDAGYRVLYFEVESDTECAEVLLKATGAGTANEQKAELLVFGGHGSRTSLTFERDSQPQEGDHGSLDFSDEEFFEEKGLAGVLSEGGQIVLDSCSNGEGRADTDNMANFMRRIFEQAKERGIWSATESYGPLEFHFDENGKLERVDFPVPGYQAYIDNDDRMVIIGNTA
jgi:hypothetical protein